MAVAGGMRGRRRTAVDGSLAASTREVVRTVVVRINSSGEEMTPPDSQFAPAGIQGHGSVADLASYGHG